MAHPAIVRETLLDSQDRPWVVAIYGTSNRERTGPEYFDLSFSAGAHCGLGKPTRFNLKRQARLPWAEEYFEGVRGLPAIPRALQSEAVRELQIQIAHFERSIG